MFSPSSGCQKIPHSRCWPQHVQVRGKIDILAIGADSHMYHNSWNGESWQSGWDSLEGSFASLAPSLVSWAPSHLGAFGVDRNTGRLLYKSRNNTAWDSDWSNIGGPTLDRPVAVKFLGKQSERLINVDGARNNLCPALDVGT